jgi:hypothetical protein
MDGNMRSESGLVSNDALLGEAGEPNVLRSVAS